MKRRTFIKDSLIVGAGLSALPLYAATFNNKPHSIVLIGAGWWGMNILREAMQYGNCKVLGICDVDGQALSLALKEVETLVGSKPKAYKDFRDAITEQKPDIVIVGTPDHWHAIPAIFAIQHGAHVYLEKPIAHTIEEGRAILNAARKYERKVQVGTHRRLSKHNNSAMDFLRSGKVGEISQVKTFVNYREGPGTINPDSEAPDHLDWDFWLGPAPKRDFNSRIHPNGFRNYLDYANGQVANWGIHWFDQVLWWTEEKYPKTVYSTGGRFVKNDGSDAPDTQLAIYEFDSFVMEWEHKLCAQNFNEDHQFGCYFYGTLGTFYLGWRQGWTFYPKAKGQQAIHMPASLTGPDFHNVKESWADFVSAIENDTLPSSDIESGHLATNMSLLAMISLNTGRSLQWDGKKDNIVNDKEANKLLTKDYRGEWFLPS